MLIQQNKFLVKPLVKWVGGKRQLLPELERRLPLTFNNYFEPFVGGGALFFHLVQRMKGKQWNISDLNEDLIRVYTTVRDTLPELIIRELTVHSNNHDVKDNKYYNEIRARYNKRNSSDVELTAQFLYLNKTCFNGLYRVNKKDEFNVPMGSYKNPNIVQADNITFAHILLQGVSIKCQPFQQINPEREDFVYFDPPYIPLNSTSDFNSYTKGKFDTSLQIALRNKMDELDEKGVKFMVSNSDTEQSRNLYEGYIIDSVKASRNVNSNGNKRGKVGEIIVRNY